MSSIGNVNTPVGASENRLRASGGSKGVEPIASVQRGDALWGSHRQGSSEGEAGFEQRGNRKLSSVMLSLKYLLRHFSNMENVNEHTGSGAQNRGLSCRPTFWINQPVGNKTTEMGEVAWRETRG